MDIMEWQLENKTKETLKIKVKMRTFKLKVYVKAFLFDSIQSQFLFCLHTSQTVLAADTVTPNSRKNTADDDNDGCVPFRCASEPAHTIPRPLTEECEI